MITHPFRPQVTSLRSIRNARSRITVSGSDPIFRRVSVASDGPFVPTFWSSGFYDRLPLNLTRYHE